MPGARYPPTGRILLGRSRLPVVHLFFAERVRRRIPVRVTAAVMPERLGRWSLEALELVDPAPHEVVVRVVASGICQTDVHARDGFFPLPCPAVYGHEGAGVVERVGSAVTTLQPGDHVIMANPSCGTCA